MKIKNIKVWSADLKNTKPYTIAFKTIDEVLNVFIEVELQNGIRGIGAGNPSEYVTGEYLNSAIDVLQEKNLEFLAGRNIYEIHQLTFEILHKFPKNPAARAALEIALFDAFTQMLDIPLVKYLGQKIYSLPTSVTIGIKNVAETLQEAKDYKEKGFKVLKVKLGKDLEEDIERIIKLREKYAQYFVIRIDANQGYDVPKTIAFYERTRHLNVELIEQPLPAKSVDEMKTLPAPIRNIIAADESLLSPENAWQLVQPPLATGIFNIKLMKCGGISQALRIAEIGLLAGVDLFWGCNDESIVSITGALHVSFACPHTKYIDLDGSLDLAKDIVKGGFNLKDGVMSCLDKPGLGLERIN